MPASLASTSLKIAVALVLLGIAAVFSVTIGTRSVPWTEIRTALGGQTETIGSAAVAVRLPRTALAPLAGGALGVAGDVMQGINRNPLADPWILGINRGAALFVVTGIAFFDLSGPAAYLWVGVAGAGAAAIFVYTIGALGRDGPTPLKLTLAGTATSITASSSLIAVVLPRNDIAGNV
ncbi:iron complex transport system permease protein [Palleronia aestuarii]|uniref:Iron complex transport system permease protein n=1 Tax=Palleronia aestuarii TaxID=568105 RepID=A0A2W7N4Y9_9RHOB|nr:iron complex transport system permease protein [Palleronia aestuarii]